MTLHCLRYGRMLLVLLLASLLCACLHPRYALEQGVSFTREMGLIDNYDLARRNHYVLPSQAALYVAESVPEVIGLPEKTGLAGPAHAAFYGLFANVSKGRLPQARKQAIASARLMDADYLIYPALVVWDDDVGSWADLQDWRRRRDLDIQDPLPDPALVTEEVRRKQLQRSAEKREQAARDQYYRWREANTDGRLDLWKIRYAQSRERLDQLGSRFLESGTDSMEWAHGQLRALVLWLRSREYDGLGLDQVAVRVDIVEVRSGYSVETALLTGDSGLVSFIGDTPQNLGEGAIREFAISLSPHQHSRDAAMARYSYF